MAMPITAWSPKKPNYVSYLLWHTYIYALCIVLSGDFWYVAARFIKVDGLHHGGVAPFWSRVPLLLSHWMINLGTNIC
jgi:hypothetical protein